jgi:ferritin-like metal-binding protein YciE
MPAITELNDLFCDMLKDIYYAEKKILKALPKMAKAVGKQSKLAEAFRTHEKQTVGQIERLEQVFEIINEKAKGKKCEAIEGLTAEADELMESCENKAVLEAGLLAGAQAVEHYEMARYGTLVEWAKLLGHEDAAALLQETLEEEKETDELLNEMATNEINQKAMDANSKQDDEDEEQQPSKTQTTRRKAA